MELNTYEPFHSSELTSVTQSLTEHFAIFRTDAHGLITYTNKNFLKLSQWTPKRVLNKSLWQMFPSTKEGQQQANDLWKRLLDGKTFFGNMEKMTRDGETYFVVLLAIPMLEEDQLQSAIFIELDMTDEMMLHQKLENIAYIDFETGLYSRHKLEQLVNKQIKEKQDFALVHLQIDYYASLKRQLDHDTQQIILKEFTNRLKRFFQDSPIARIGLNEFVVLTPFADWFIQGFLNFLEQQPIMIQPLDTPLSISGGIARFPDDQQSYDYLLEAAMNATSNVAKAGGGQIEILSRSHHEQIDRKAQIYDKIPKALNDGEIYVVYQPQYDLRSGEITSYEALIRWHDDELGQISPEELIPLAENCGFIQSLGRFVLDEATKLAAKWHKEGRNLSVSINTSAREFMSSELSKYVLEILEENKCPPEALQIEVTERFAFQAEEEKAIVQNVQQLTKAGIRFALDDFGTGFASFRYLQSLPISKIKMDKSYIQGMITQPKTRKLVEGLVQLGHSLDLVVTAEGVETKEQLEIVQSLGFDTAQGYYFNEPMRENELTIRLDEQ